MSIFIPLGEVLVETKTCRLCSGKFPITDQDLEFYEKVSPVFPLSPTLSPEGRKGVKDLGNGNAKYLIPTPTLCPDCRQQRRLSFRNERKLYKRTCDATGKEIISAYSPDKPFKVYDQKEWWSDKWSPLDYGKNFNFSKGFFEQFRELRDMIPRMSLINAFSENSEYTNHSYYNKNCYLCFESWYNENCMHGTSIKNSLNCIDCEICIQSHHCYECLNINNCQECYFSLNLKDCFNCYYSTDCIWCKNCYRSHNQLNKEYLIFNKQVTKIEFEDFMKDENFNKNLQLEDFSKRIVKNLNIVNCESCIWDNLINSKNSYLTYDSADIENIKYSWKINAWKNAYDYDIWWENSENIYEVHCSWSSYNLFFSNISWGNLRDIFYCDYCIESSHLFGCSGLRNKQYCILNKQYTKEEYEALVPKIIEHMKKSGEWGEFFPSSISPFGYNETVASEYSPLTKSEAKKKNFNWSDYEAPFPKVEKIIPASKLPDDITKIPDDILNWAIECEVTKKPFRIIKQELEFYRKHNLPIPRHHPDQRHLDRMALRNPRKLFERKCDKCKIDMFTTYAPERPEIVYCEACYTKEVIG